MDEKFDFRALLLKLQDCLSDNDRRRLHFLVGDIIPRQLRDDPTLGGTLSLLESLFDRAKISEQDFDYLIHAFNEIHCYDAVKRLKEHQRTQRRSGTISTGIFDDNDEDKIATPNFEPLQSDCPSTFESISIENKSNPFAQQDKRPNIAVNSHKKEVNIYLTSIKQTIRSRFTACQLALVLLNIAGIITIIAMSTRIKKFACSSNELLLIKVGPFYGTGIGGRAFNDAEDGSLTLNDRVVSVHAGWSSQVVDYVTFIYSNSQSKQHGALVARTTDYTYGFDLNVDERIDGVTVYTGIRKIDNVYAPNGTFLIVGLRFRTNQGRISAIFGSSNGTERSEFLANYTLAYVRGQAEGYIDRIQFVWIRESPRTTSAALPTY